MAYPRGSRLGQYNGEGGGEDILEEEEYSGHGRSSSAAAAAPEESGYWINYAERRASRGYRSLGPPDARGGWVFELRQAPPIFGEPVVPTEPVVTTPETVGWWYNAGLCLLQRGKESEVPIGDGWSWVPYPPPKSVYCPEPELPEPEVVPPPPSVRPEPADAAAAVETPIGPSVPAPAPPEPAGWWVNEELQRSEPGYEADGPPSRASGWYWTPREPPEFPARLEPEAPTLPLAPLPPMMFPPAATTQPPPSSAPVAYAPYPEAPTPAAQQPAGPGSLWVAAGFAAAAAVIYLASRGKGGGGPRSW